MAKDLVGTEIKVGDIVAYAKGAHKKLYIGVVERISNKTVGIRQYEGADWLNYHKFKDVVVLYPEVISA